MATRPIFIPHINGEQLVEIRAIDFEWHAGMAASQKQKSIASLHTAASARTRIQALLEISSKSRAPEGVALSAFNLETLTPEGKRCTVECAFQGSKVFDGGGPYTDLIEGTSLDAKRDPRLQSSGPLREFAYFGRRWALEPKTAFYDWLYVNAVRRNPPLGAALRQHEAFTDIEFNPARSINCQAHAAALYVALEARGLLDTAGDPDAFLALVSPKAPSSARQQAVLDL
jgi:hypothetical protein